ncbi:MAG TPA: alpha/beta hydrolase, partial [Polyangiaceae bacterium]|nr:alpha/beta hydrolase [Polyangiaceae bacterium]
MLKRLSRALPVALALMGCSAPSEILDVSYDDRFGERTTMDIYLPAGEPTQSPAIVMIHGGAWRFGSKDAYRDAAVRMARSGWVAVTINYRLGSAGMYPRAVQDCVCAISFLRRNADDYGIDPNRVAVTGYSAGGHLASLVGLAADLPEHVPDCASGGTTLPNAIISAAGAQDLHG